MNILLVLLLYFFAGIINGSFATPSKYIKHWKFENIWLQHALWAFLILPWIAAFIFAPQILQIYSTASVTMIGATILCGFLFGIGQIASAFAIHIIGIGLTFVICIGLSTALGFLLPLAIQHPEKIFTPFGYVTITGTLLAILGFIFSTYAGKLRGGNAAKQGGAKSNKSYFLGVSLALFAGLFSAGQNICFALTGSLQKIAISLGVKSLGAALIVWPAFLTFAFIPYAAYMVFLLYKNKSFVLYRGSDKKNYFFLTFVMGMCWYGSLMFYSKASQLGGALGPIVGWPIFMVLIIITSNVWSWIHKEWKNAGRAALTYLWIGLSLLVMSVLILAYGSAIV